MPDFDFDFEDIQEFDINFDGFNTVVDAWNRRLSGQPNVWFQITDAALREHVARLVRMYIVLNHHSYRNRLGKPDSIFLNLTLECANYGMPRFIRDAIRELCRPMTRDGCIYIPRLDSVDGDIVGEAFGLNSLILNKTIEGSRRCKLELVGLEIEPVLSLPLSVWHEEERVLAFDRRAPEWREKAVGILRHVRFVRDVVRPENLPQDILVQTLMAQELRRGPFAGTAVMTDNQKLIVNGTHWWTTFPATLSFQWYVADDSRFPTVESHSSTPPGSARKRKKPKDNKSRLLPPERTDVKEED